MEPRLLSWASSALAALALAGCSLEDNPPSVDNRAGTGGAAAGAGTGGTSDAGQPSSGAGGTVAGTDSGGTSGDGGTSGGVAGSTAGSSGTTAGGTGGAAGSSGAGQGGGGQGGAGAGGGGQGGTTAGTGGTGGTAGVSAYNPCPPAGQPCKILPFGDSITDGFNVPGGYRMELFRLARQAGKSLTYVGSAANGPTEFDGVAFPRSHEGHSGYTIENEPQVGRNGISPLVGSSTTAYTPHIVTLMIGTNDVNLSVDLATAPQRLAALMDSILATDSNLLLAVAQLVPTRTDTENVRVQAYNAAIPALVTSRAMAGRHVLLVDMYGAFTSDANYKTALLADNLHPSTAGYTRMAQTWYGALQSYLR